MGTRSIRAYKGSTRPPNIDSDAWAMLLTPKDRARLGKEYEDQLKASRMRKRGVPCVPGVSGEQSPAHLSHDPSDHSRIIVFGMPTGCRPFQKKETNFSGSVEYNTAAPALSGITAVVKQELSPSDLILLNCDQRQTCNKYCKSFLKKLEELLIGVESAIRCWRSGP